VVNRSCNGDFDQYGVFRSDAIPEEQKTDVKYHVDMIEHMRIFDSEDFYYNYLPYLTDIQKPQFLLVGEYDMTCGKFEQEWFDKHAPNGKTIILADSAHLSWFENPEKYTDLVKQFILSLY
jgi:proline iminopeptidase